MNYWHDIETGAPTLLNVIIEIPKESRVKYELDKDTGLIKVDRVLYSPMHYPANYGFVPRTLWDDGDPLDVLVLGQEELVPGCLIKVRPIGVLFTNDSGESDAKVLAVPEKDPRFTNTKDITDLEPHLLEEIAHFFKTYKELQKKVVTIEGWEGAGKAAEVAEQAVRSYKEKFNK